MREVLRARDDPGLLPGDDGALRRLLVLGLLPDGVGARIDPAAWERPPVYDWLTRRGGEEDELRRVFNCGIGYCAVVPAGDVGDGDVVIGELVGSPGVEWR